MFFQMLQLLIFNILQHPALSQPQSVTSFNMVMGAGGVRPKGGFQWAGVLMDWAASEGH